MWTGKFGNIEGENQLPRLCVAAMEQDQHRAVCYLNRSFVIITAFLFRRQAAVILIILLFGDGFAWNRSVRENQPLPAP